MISLRTRRGVIAISVLVGLLAGLLEGVLGAVVFERRPVLDSLLLDVSGFQIYVRSLILFLIVLFGAIMSGTVGRLVKAEESLKSRLEFERVTSIVSSKFVGAAAADDAINASLAAIGKLSKASRAYLFLFNPDETTMDNTHEWCAEGVSPQIDNLKDLPAAMFPWWLARLRRGEVIHIRDVSQMPPEAAAEKETLESQNVKSLLVLPVHVAGKLAGFVGFDNVAYAGDWGADDLAILRITAEILGNAHGRKQLEDELRVRAKLLDRACDHIILIGPGGKLRYANDAFCQAHGYSKEEVIGMSIGQFDRSVLNEATDSQVLRMLEKKGEAMFETTHFRKDGTIMDVEVHARLIHSGGETLLLSIERDIVDRKKMREQLIAQDRLASIGQLVSGVAHELNNPLTSVIGFSDILLQKDLPEDVKGQLEIINGEAQRTVRIVKNLLTFARKQPEEKSHTDINEGIQKVLDLRGYEQKASNIDVKTIYDRDLPIVMGNGSQLQQVFFNLVINAEFFMRESHGRGTLTITTSRVGDFVRASFADDGPGISAENMRPLFTPFFTTKQVGQGTGLGLSICQGIVTEHGGRIWAESEPDNGATFVIELPALTTADKT